MRKIIDSVTQFQVEKTPRREAILLRNKKILEMCLGVDGVVYTLEEIAEEFGVTESRVRQIKFYFLVENRRRFIQGEVFAEEDREVVNGSYKYSLSKNSKPKSYWDDSMDW